MTSSPGLRGRSRLLQAGRGVLQTTTDAKEQNNTAPPTLCVGGPVITCCYRMLEAATP